MKIKRWWPTILEIEDAFDWGQELIEKANDIDNWESSQTLAVDGYSSQLTPNIRSSFNVLPRDYETTKHFHEQYMEILHKIVLPAYNDVCLRVPENEHISAPYLLRYRLNEQYVLHSDGRFVQGRYRLFSIVSYMNDNYTGGELYFSEQDLTLKPKAGSIIIFPSTDMFLHASLPVLSGTKYSMPCWVTYNHQYNLVDIVKRK